jgi:hypothetical protein
MHCGGLSLDYQAQPLICPEVRGLRPAPHCHAHWASALDFLAPRINYSSCHNVAQLYSMRLHSGDMAHIRDTAPVICRGFLFVRYVMPRGLKGERRVPSFTAPAAVPARRHGP